MNYSFLLKNIAKVLEYKSILLFAQSSLRIFCENYMLFAMITPSTNQRVGS
jgi:hypothetical protein